MDVLPVYPLIHLLVSAVLQAPTSTLTLVVPSVQLDVLLVLMDPPANPALMDTNSAVRLVMQLVPSLVLPAILVMLVLLAMQVILSVEQFVMLILHVHLDLLVLLVLWVLCLTVELV